MNRNDKRDWFWVLLVAVVLIVVLLVIGNRVEAQDVVTVAPQGQGWIALLQQLLLLVVTGVAIPAALQFLRERGLRIEQKHADHIQRTAENAAALMLDPSLTMDQKKAAAMSYMRTGAREAMDYFQSNPERIFAIVQSYYNRLLLTEPNGGRAKQMLASSVSDPALRGSM